MIEVIESRKSPDIQTFRSLPRRDYLGLMDAADVMVGNSSSGIIEAPSFDLPVVDIGPRQDGRERAGNVRSVSYERNAIEIAIKKCLQDDSDERASDSSNPFDYGGAGKRIADRLAEVELSADLLRKRLTF